MSLHARLLAVVGLCFTSATVHAAGLSVEPSSLRVSRGDRTERLIVSLRIADGSERDLTETARYRSDDPRVAVVDAVGVVRAVGDGRTTIRVESPAGDASVPVVVEGFVRESKVGYRLDVAPVLSKAGCNAGPCHGNINGKGGFRLSLRGEDAGFDHVALTRDAFGRRVDPAEPDASLILTKPTGRAPHEGGVRFAVGSPEHRALERWIASGLRDDAEEAPTVVRLEVFPKESIVAAPALSRRLRVTAEFSDGSRRDVTRLASYDLNDPTVASITADGRVEAKSPVEVAVAARYLSGRAVARVAFLPDRPDFVWRAPEPRNDIDRHVFAKLKALKIRPAEPAPDSVFVRRAYLDAIGILPTAEEVRRFLADADPDKRAKLAAALVERPEFADFWALKWADLLRNEEKTMGDKGVWVFQRWLRDQIASDTPLDQFAASIVSAKGSTWSNPPAGFHRTNRDPQTAAETVGQVFLGVRLQCARCHNHPFDNWTQNDYYGLAAHFANVERKLCDPNRKDRFDNHEIVGDVIVHLSGEPRMIQPRSGESMRPKPPGGPVAELGADPDALDSLARWLTKDNRQFARNMANRIWFHLMGRGVVEPVDDFRDSNPPSNPALLEALTDDFVADGLRLKPLARRILSSAAYGLGSETNETNAGDEANFSKAAVRLLPAEVLLDSIAAALGRERSIPNAPRGSRAVQQPGAGTSDAFLREFGKPARLLTCECERTSDTTLAQAFQLLNGDAIREMLEDRDNRVGRLIASGRPDAAVLEELSLSILGRPPTATESAGLLRHVASAKDRRKGWEDAAWAMINSKEFLLRH